MDFFVGRFDCQVTMATQGCLPRKPEEGSKLQLMWKYLTLFKEYIFTEG